MLIVCMLMVEQKEGGVGSLTREVALERELTDAQEKLNKLKLEKDQLEASVQVTHAVVSTLFVFCRICLLYQCNEHFLPGKGIATSPDGNGSC